MCARALDPAPWVPRPVARAPPAPREPSPPAPLPPDVGGVRCPTPPSQVTPRTPLVRRAPAVIQVYEKAAAALMIDNAKG